MPEKTTQIKLLGDAERYEDLHYILSLPADFEPPCVLWPPQPEAYGPRAGAVAWLLENAPIALVH